MTFLRIVAAVTAVAALGGVGGCAWTATAVWSPDGSRAAYGTYRADQPNSPPVDWTEVDAEGRRLADLGTGLSPFMWSYAGLLPVGWSADSRTLYAARPVTGLDGPATLWRWPGSGTGKPERVATLGDADVIAVRPSPDGRWVAALCDPRGPVTRPAADRAKDASPLSCRVLAIRLSDGSVREVSAAAGLGLCFTGPDRVAFISEDLNTGGHLTGKGQIVEADLSNPAAGPTPLLDADPTETGEVEAVDDGLVFLAVPRSYPAPVSHSVGHIDRYKLPALYHWTRTNSQLAAIEDSAVAVAPSPDGRRVLAVVQPKGATNLAVVVERPDGTDCRMVRRLVDDKIAILPAWRGNDHVTLQSAEAVDDRQTDRGEVAVYDWVDLPIARAGPAKILSHGWPMALRPTFLAERPATTTVAGPPKRNR